jgi:hypothetical protein
LVKKITAMRLADEATLRGDCDSLMTVILFGIVMDLSHFFHANAT